MNIFKNRPLAFGCAVFLALLSITYKGSIKAAMVISIIGVFLLAFTLLLVFCDKGRILNFLTVYLISISLAFLICASVSVFVFCRDRVIAERYANTEGNYEILIESVEYESSYQSGYLAKCDEIGQRIFVVTNSDGFKRGQMVKADLKLQLAVNGDTDEKNFYLSDGIFLKAICSSPSIISEGETSFRIFFEGLNEKYTEKIRSYVNEETSSIISALFLGNKSFLKDSNRRDFARLGISHILALSGIHLSIIVSMVSGIFNSVGIGIRKRYLLTIGVIAFFICLTGFSESAIRSGTMLIILYTMFFFKKKADFVTEIFLSVSLICIASPYSIGSVSLLLSFFAMLGCAVSGYIMRKNRTKGFLRRIVSSLVTTVTVSLMTLPIVFLKFGFLSLVAPISNLVFIPLFTVLLFISPFLLFFGGMGFVGRAVSFVCEGLTGVILDLSGFLASFRGIVIPLKTEIDRYGVAILFLSIVLVAVLKKKSILIGLCVMTVGVSLISYQGISLSVERAENNYVRTYGDDRGDRTYIESNGRICIIDSKYPSKSSFSEAYKNVIDMGYMEIEMYVVTDYSAYLADAVSMLTDYIYVRKMAIPTPLDEDEFELFLKVETILEENNVKLIEIPRKMEFEDIKIYFAPTEFLPRSTKRLVAYYMEGQTSRYTYAGSATYESRSVYNFVEKSINASDVVFFGGSGPKFKYRYEYDLSNVKYLMFSTKAVYYCKAETQRSRTVLEGRVFVLE
ncbi:MAG: ComEC/Rec2 family competence protein [Clostridia bacterium]|nr:ComEC/Rec2 family competence protein [Clostridia bacterium]